ncbi:MAG: tetratricopeptide repeat protein [Candidatus Hydrothermarchaeales archaeon]
MAEGQSDVDVIFSKATELHNKGDLKKAAQLYHEVLEIDESNAKAYVLLANILYYSGESIEAEEYCLKAIEVDPDYAMAYFNIGVIKQDKGDLDGAVEFYEKAIENNSEYPQAYYNLGALLRDKGDLFEAFKNFKKALDLDKNATISKEEMEKIFDRVQNEVMRREIIRDAEELLMEGGVMEKEGDLEMAVEFYKRAIKLNPESIIACYLLGMVYEKLGDMRLALETYNRILDIDPDVGLRDASLESIKLLKHLTGVPLLSIEDLSKTAEAFQHRLREKPREMLSFRDFITEAKSEGLEYFLKQGIKVESQGDIDEAIKEYKRAIEANPRASLPYYLLGLCFESTDDMDGAIENYQKAAALDSNLSTNDSWVLSALLSDNLGGITMNAYECFETLNNFKKSAGKKEGGSLVAFAKKRISRKSVEELKKGYLLDSGGNASGALQKFREAVRIDPNNAIAYVILGLAQESLEVPDEAMKQYTKMDELDFNSASRDVPDAVLDIVNEYMTRTTASGHRVGSVLTKYIELVVKNPDKMLELLDYIEDIKLDSISSIIRGHLKDEVVPKEGGRIIKDVEDFRVEAAERQKEVPKQVGVGADMVSFIWKYKTARTIKSIAIDSHGSSTLAGSETGVLYHLDKNGGLLRKLQMEAAVIDLDVSHDAAQAVVALQNGVVRQIDLKKGEVLWEIDLSKNSPRSVAVSKDGKHVAVGLQDSHIAKLSRGRVEWMRATRGFISGVGISKDGRIIVGASDEGNLYVIKEGVDLTPDEEFISLHKPLRTMAISPDGKYVAASTDDGDVYLFDEKKNVLWKRELGQIAYGLCVSKDARHVVVGLSNGKALLHDREGRSLWEYSSGDNIWDVDISEDGKSIVLGCGLVFGGVYLLKSTV